MKKTTTKLVIRSETLRVLRELDKPDLVRVIGGADTLVADSTDTQSGFNCPLQAAMILTRS